MFIGEQETDTLSIKKTTVNIADLSQFILVSLMLTILTQTEATMIRLTYRPYALIAIG